MSGFNASLECPICFDKYSSSDPGREPVIGACSHTVCRSCAVQVQIGNGQCPTCNTIMAFFNYKKNFGMIDMIETLEAREKELQTAKEEKERLQKEREAAEANQKLAERQRDQSQRNLQAVRKQSEIDKKLLEFVALERSLNEQIAQLKVRHTPTNVRTLEPKVLYVRPLLDIVDRDILKLFFEQYGEIDRITLVQHPKAEQNKGCAYIAYKNEEDPKRAIQGLNGKEILGQTVTVKINEKRSNPTNSRSKTPAPIFPRLSSSGSSNASRPPIVNNTQYDYTKLHIKNLPPMYTVSHLDVIFSKYGKITDREVFERKNDKGIAMGLVKFEFESDARKARDEVNGKEFVGHKLKIDFFRKRD